MIVVTGTKRSGTSMWMQILEAAGLPLVGAAFPAVWEQSIRDANPRGFHESHLRTGIYYATNPHPETGEFVPPRASARHVVKVFVPGLVRSDLAYLDRVVASFRHWRAYPESLGRLYALEDDWIRVTRGDRLERVRRARGAVPPVIEWWFEMYELFRDVATRGYPFHLVPYDRVVDDPRAAIGRVLAWIGEGDLDAAVAAVAPDLRRTPRAAGPFDGVDEGLEQLLDELCAMVVDTGRLSPAMLHRMNEAQLRLEDRWLEPRTARPAS